MVAHSLGLIVESEKGDHYINRTLISKNSRVPAEVSRRFRLPVRSDGATTLDVYLTQGESDDPLACAYLGRYIFDGFPPLASSWAEIDITYSYDRDSLVHIRAEEQSHHIPLHLTVEPVPDDVPARFAAPPSRANVSGKRAHVYLAFDLSGSMRGEPLARAKEAAKSLVLNLNLATTAVGLISFSDRVSLDQAATHDLDEILRAIDAMYIGATGHGNLGQPFDDLYTALSTQADLKFGVVLTDGVWVNQWRAIERARRCHAAGIQIFAIGFGKADQAFLKQIASSDEQSLFTDLSGLTEAFTSIAREVKQTVELGLPAAPIHARER